MRITRTVAVLASVILLVAWAAADEHELWQGAFRTSSAWGAMEMSLSGERPRDVRIRFEIRREVVDAGVHDLAWSPSSLSFAATLGGRTYQFAGAFRNRQWTGTMTAAGSPADRGTWRLAAVDLSDPTSSADPLPAPSGRYRTGRVVFHWIDGTRPELETRSPDDRRQILAWLFYPTDARAAPAPYMADAELMRSTWGGELTDRVRALTNHSQDGAPLLRSSGRLPIVLFAPGRGQKVLSYTTLLEDLASHGYVVAAIEPAYNAPAMQLPDGKVIGPLAPGDRGVDEPKTLRDWLAQHQQIVIQWARDLHFALDSLTTIDRSDQRFFGRLDLTRVGAFGHSFGGFAAGTVRLLDVRVRGAINLDGNETGTPFESIPDASGPQPFAWIEGPYEHPSAAALERAHISEAQWRDMYADGDRQMRSLAGGGLRLTVTRFGLDHMDFSDQPFWQAGLTGDARAGKLRTLSLTREYVRAFFDGCLKGQWDALRKLAEGESPAWPEVEVRRFGTPWAK